MEGRKTQSAIVTLQDGKTYKADFDMGALANAEMAYERYFGKKMGVNDIVTELVGSGTRAMMSFMYGAMISAGEKITSMLSENGFSQKCFIRAIDNDFVAHGSREQLLRKHSLDAQSVAREIYNLLK